MRGVAEAARRKEWNTKLGASRGSLCPWPQAEWGDTPSLLGGRSESPLHLLAPSFPWASSTVQQPLGKNSFFLASLSCVYQGLVQGLRMLG